MEGGNESSKGTNSGANADKVGSYTEPLTFKPFSQLSDIRECDSSKRIKRDKPPVRKKTDRVEDHTDKILCYGIRYTGLKPDAGVNPITYKQRRG